MGPLRVAVLGQTGTADYPLDARKPADSAIGEENKNFKSDQKT
jgi:hypothetical protein